MNTLVEHGGELVKAGRTNEVCQGEGGCCNEKLVDDGHGPSA